MNIDLSSRSASKADYNFLWNLHVATMKEYVDKTWGWVDDFQEAKFRKNFDPTLLEIIQSEETPIGYISVERRPDLILLISIEITPSFQRQGIGTRLIRGLLVEGHEKNHAVQLYVLKVNPARKLYERLGFHVVGETDTHFTMKTGVQEKTTGA